MASKYSIQLLDHMSQSDLERLYMTMLQSAKSNGDTNPETLQYRAISLTKDYLKDILLKSATAASTTPTPEEPTIAQLAEIQQLRDREESTINQDDFFKKVKELDAQRQRIREAAIKNTTPPTALPVQATPPVPMPPAAGKDEAAFFVINSLNRKWSSSPARHTFLWTGPAPRRIFEMVCVWMPALRLTAPYFYLEIQGAGGQTETFALMMESGAPSPWIKYVPLVASTPSLSTPWTIRLLDAMSIGERQPLTALGYDGLKIKEIKYGDGPFETTIAYIAFDSTPDQFTIGDQLIFGSFPVTVPVTVIGILRGTNGGTIIKVDGLSQENKIEPETPVLNLNRQVAILFKCL